MTTALSNQPLLKDRAFWGLNATQFLGAFNDNLFKELVLLICVAAPPIFGPNTPDNKGLNQGLATVAFSVPFIFLSGFAGFLSDRFSKRTIAFWCKIAEIGLVLAGLIGFYLGSLPLLILILGLMGAHSAMFGPPKYGILPELFHKSELPKANGLLLMTTFLAIIFGLALAGFLADLFHGRLWIASIACLFVAITGTITVLLLREPGVADPHLKFTLGSMFISRSTWQLITSKKGLLPVLIASSVFWMVAGMVYPNSINALGKTIHGFSDTQTGLMAATTGLGIAVGCVFAGIWCRDKVRGRLVTVGLVGLTGCLILLGMPGAEGFKGKPWLSPIGASIALVGVGLFAGMYSVPLQTFLQAMASDGQKGRIIGVMNLVNWIGIALAGVIYIVSVKILGSFGLSEQFTFWVGAGLLVPLLIFFRPPTVNLSELEAATTPLDAVTTTPPVIIPGETA
ncbi:major facilitator superfamily MFS_1 [Planctopirus limnophila DSM 3776]|uniref:Major facilitator superfamily MFS_1 n=1 Tax=Planctopirus limnophila (strain ATCC 43296 / DSM 3776 / IFAM 1008 / Mu 290) TaxID=521674 RepID=D5SNC6_PLAL2|nr:MFS transporter [Planctopirus limnophila]ADG66053.1 major facilitator superfamily MFS_1 [Planctopirus limnophila DSM 3776]